MRMARQLAQPVSQRPGGLPPTGRAQSLAEPRQSIDVALERLARVLPELEARSHAGVSGARTR